MATFDFATFLTNLRTDLEARPNLSGVKVRTLPQNPEENPAEGISFDRVRGGHEWHTMGPNFRDGYSVEGRIWAIAAETGSEYGSASRDRAAALLTELVAIFEDESSTIRTGVLASRLDEWRYTPLFAPGDGSAVAQIEFTIAVASLV